MLLNDEEIEQHCLDRNLWFDGRPLVSPFLGEGMQDGVISYGLTSAGYDVRLDGEVLIFKSTYFETVNPKRFKDPEYVARMFDRYVVKEGGEMNLPGLTYALVQTFEEFSVPRWISGTCVGKSTYARSGLIVNTTPLEPEWCGKLTVEVFACRPVTLFVGEGICQIRFELIKPCRRSYADKKGKYQGQQTVTPPRVK